MTAEKLGLKGKDTLVTAGPTREMLDPVRFLSNLSTGEMGYAVAKAARKRGSRVTLISGPTGLKPPAGVLFIPVTSAQEMESECRKVFLKHDVLIMTAAVCDFTAKSRHWQKIRRTRTKSFLLKQTPDIVAGLARRKSGRIVIGFCLETENWIGNALRKLKRKNLDGIVANYYGGGYVPFGNRKITTAFIQGSGPMKLLKKQSKSRVAGKLLDWVVEIDRKRMLKK